MSTQHSTTTGARTAVVISGAAVLLALGVIPALGYVQVNADGAPVDRDGTSSATTVEVSSDISDISVVPADGDDITWHVGSSDARTRVEVHDENGTLRIDVERPDHGWLGNAGIWNLGNDSADIHLEVPAGIELSVESDVGEIDVQGEFVDLELRSDVGDVRVAGTAANVVVVTDVGELDARGLWSAGTIELRSDVGDVQADTGSSEAPGDIRVTSSVGSVSIAVAPVADAYDVRASSSIGEVNDRVTATAPPGGSASSAARSGRSLIDVSSSVGDVTVEYSTRD